MVQHPKAFTFELLVSRLIDWHWWHFSASDHCLLILLPLSVLPSKLCGSHSMSLSPRRIFEFLNIKFKHSLGLWYPLLTKKTNTLGFCFSERPMVRHKQYWCQALILCPPKSGRAALLALKVLRGFLSRFPGRASQLRYSDVSLSLGALGDNFSMARTDFCYQHQWDSPSTLSVIASAWC